MQRLSNDFLLEEIKAVITDNLGAYIIESVEYMLESSDMTKEQQLAVLDGALAFGNWALTSAQRKELRVLRLELTEGDE